jgi:hypothetical protein
LDVGVKQKPAVFGFDRLRAHLDMVVVKAQRVNGMAIKFGVPLLPKLKVPQLFDFVALRNGNFAGGSSVCAVKITVILPLMRSGKSVIALALNGVTRCAPQLSQGL